MRQDPYLLSRSAMAIRILPTIILPASLIASSFTTTGSAASESSAANAAAPTYRVLVMAAMLMLLRRRHVLVAGCKGSTRGKRRWGWA